jgi:dihydroflavonol-4-reductase
MILVTGATGHIGNVLVRRLVDSGEEVAVLSHMKQPAKVFGGLPVKICEGDVTEYSSLKTAFRGIDVVYHLAAKISISSGELDLLMAINTQGTANVVKACLKNRIKRLVYVSSVHALVETPKGAPIIEKVPDTLKNVWGDYAKSKVLAYREVMKGFAKGLDVVVVFPTGVIGPYDHKPSQIGQLIKNYLQGKTVNYIDGKYDYVDVRDVVSGIILAAKKGKSGEGYLLGGHMLSVNEIFTILENVSGTKARLRKIPLWLAYYASFFAELYSKLKGEEPVFTPYSVKVLQSNSLISFKKAHDELGYKARPVVQTLGDAVAWFRGERVSIN